MDASICIQVIWKRLYSTKSTAEKGTMYQLKNLINRSAVPLDLQDNMKTAEDFLLLLLHAHVVQAQNTIRSFIPSESVVYIAKAIVNNYVLLSSISDKSVKPNNPDQVHLYAKELLTLSLIWHGFHDAIKNSDGDRIFRYWKVLLVVFKSTDCCNYGKEAVNLLLQHDHLLSPRKAAQLKWSRCINTTGQRGANIPCDLHLEHLNRRLKGILRNLGSNINPKSIIKAGQMVATVYRVCRTFESTTTGKLNQTHHPYPSFCKDLNLVLDVLHKELVFTPLKERCHKTFNKLKYGLFEGCEKGKMIKKVQASIDQLLHT